MTELTVTGDRVTMQRNLPEVERQNDKSACWTCLDQGLLCDGGLPRCRTCSRIGVRCRGYAIRLRWPADIKRTTKNKAAARRRSESSLWSGLPANTGHGVGFPSSISSLGLPAKENFFMQHYTHNVARIALAVDYTGNGYRSLIPMAMQEPALLNAALAVAASHHSRWQHTADTLSRKYLRAASKALRDRFLTPSLVHSQVTLAVMLLLVSFEVFSGSSRWKGHYDAIRGWIRSRGDCSDIDPFLKTWVCLLDTQSALNLGQPAMPELESWLNAQEDSTCQGNYVDALFGCSSGLPKLMWAASRLYVSARDGKVAPDELRNEADALQAQIRSTEIILDSDPLVNISCQSAAQPFTTVGMGQEELRRRMVATAEIFRHASHIYVHRAVHGPGEPLTGEMRASLDTARELLTIVPDALGPGANLGWCLVVVGSEMDAVHDREYVLSRLQGLHLLGIHNTKNGQKILEEVWARQDLVAQGHAIPELWQNTMLRIGQSQILV